MAQVTRWDRKTMKSLYFVAMVKASRPVEC